MRAKTQTVLVLEDDDAVAGGVCELLEEAGYATVRASTIVEARRAMSARKIDGIVLDLELGDERGRHLLDDLAGFPDPPAVLILSGRPEAPGVAKEFGVPHLGKPFSVAELLVAVSTTIEHGMRPIARRQASGARPKLIPPGADVPQKNRRGA